MYKTEHWLFFFIQLHLHWSISLHITKNLVQMGIEVNKQMR